jgi:transcriptional regulator with XRE-family HTH domain
VRLPVAQRKPVVALGQFTGRIFLKPNTMKSISKRLQQLRKAAKLTQEQVAIQTGISRASYSAYEEGRAIPPLANCIALADCYGISIDELVRGKATTPAALETLLSRLTAKDRKAVEILLYG